MYKSQQQIHVTTQEGHIWLHKDFKRRFQEAPEKREFSQVLQVTPTTDWCRIPEEHLVFKVVSLWFPGDLFWFGVGFSLWIPPLTLSSCPLEWLFTLHCLMKELDTFLLFLNLKQLIKGGLMPEVIHDVGLPHGELGLVSTLM